MIENIKYSLSSTLDLYKHKAIEYYNFNLGFSLVSGLFAAFVSTGICLLGEKLYDTEFSNYRFSILTVIGDPNWSKTAMLVAIPGFGLYAAYLKELLKHDDKPSYKGFTSFISLRIWNSYFLVIGILCLAMVLTYTINLNTPIYPHQIHQYTYADYDKTSRRLHSWLNSVITLVRYYLPYLGALYILLSSQYTIISKQIIKKYTPVILTILILSFSIDAIATRTSSYISIYILELLQIPFSNNFITGIIGMLIAFSIGAYFFLGFAACLLYPVLYQQARLETESGKVPPSSEEQPEAGQPTE